MKNILMRVIRNNFDYIFEKFTDIMIPLLLLRDKFYKYFYSSKTLIQKQFKRRLGREVELNNPTKFSDKIQWLKLNWHDPLATKCADKYAVREYVKEKIGEKYLNKLYGVYNSVDEIDLHSLPDQFVLKATHGSEMNIRCKDKKKIDWEEKFKIMKNWWMKRNYYWKKREWAYKNIKPRIICEKYLEQPEYGELRDYKIYCFNGEPKLIHVDIDMFSNNHRRNFYDLEWNLKNYEIKFPSDEKEEIEKPENLDEMIEISKKLSEPFPLVRVDIYTIKNKIIFGELTFYPGNGMVELKPEEFEVVMGKWLKLPK